MFGLIFCVSMTADNRQPVQYAREPQPKILQIWSFFFAQKVGDRRMTTSGEIKRQKFPLVHLCTLSDCQCLSLKRLKCPLLQRHIMGKSERKKMDCTNTDTLIRYCIKKKKKKIWRTEKYSGSYWRFSAVNTGFPSHLKWSFYHLTFGKLSVL